MHVGNGSVNKLNQGWRLFATGLCFLLFGLGGLLMALCWLPLYHLVYRQPEQRSKASRLAVHKTFKFFVQLMECVGVVHLDRQNVSKLHDINGRIVIANHPSLIDAVVLISLIPNANCVIKQSLWRNPFMRGVIRNTGYLSNADPQGLVVQCRDSLASGSCVIIFPEGTRTEPGKLPIFQRGAAQLALRCKANFQCVLIQVTPPALTKCLPWYRVPKRKMQFLLVVRNEFDVSPYMAGNISKSVRILTRDIEALFIEELNAI